MARIDLNTPYEQFLRAQVEAGLFSSITAAAENAIARQMEAAEEKRIQTIHSLLAKGEADITQGNMVAYHTDLMHEISQKGKEAAKKNQPVKYEVR
mgnify:CR=1 FL=1